MILDVGCGKHPLGDINVDLFIEATEHRSRSQRIKEDALNVKSIPNFVLADAHYLPFKDNVFTKVISNEVIEHIEKPTQLLREMLRVSKNEIELSCPHRYGYSKKEKPMHINFFRCRWFIQTLRNLGVTDFNVVVDKFKYLPNYYIPLIRIPLGIRVNAFKTKT